MVQRERGLQIRSTRVSIRDHLVSSLLSEAGHFLLTENLSFFGVKLTTAVVCDESLGPWQTVNQKAVGVDMNLGCIRFSCCRHVSRLLSIIHQVVAQSSSVSIKTDCNIPREWMQRGMVTL